MPRVAVLLPSYMPSADHVRACFSGLDEQTFRDFEVVVVDESDEDTRGFLRDYPTSFPKRVLCPGERLGLAGSLNYGIASIDAEFIARHDIDDVCAPERLARQVAYLDAHPEIDGVGSWTMKIGAAGEHLGVRRFPTTERDVRRQIGFWNPFCHSAITLRRSFFDRYGLYGPFQNEDYELWLRSASRGAKLINIPEVLAFYRIEAGGEKSRPRRWKEVFTLRRRYLAADHLPLRLVGLGLTGIAAIAPSFLFGYVYWAFNRLR